MLEERIPCITTTDNQFNPFTEYDSWETVDCKKGYYTAYTLHEQAEWYETFLQMSQDRYYVDFGKAVVMGMMNMVYQHFKKGGINMMDFVVLHLTAKDLVMFALVYGGLAMAGKALFMVPKIKELGIHMFFAVLKHMVHDDDAFEKLHEVVELMMGGDK